MTFLHPDFSLDLKSDEGHIERFAFYVYMSSIPIFTKIKQPFALHKFLETHFQGSEFGLSRYKFVAYDNQINAYLHALH